MKKILITARNMDVGGIETSLINLLKSLDCKKYEITLVLENKEGIFLNHIPKNINVIDYNLLITGNVIFRKIKNRLHLLKWCITHKNKYDFSICYATYCKCASRIALNASKNNAIWVHGNYSIAFDYNIKNIKKFYKGIKIYKYKHCVFVSNENKLEAKKYYNKLPLNLHVINNIIDGKTILEKSKEKIELLSTNKIRFLNVGRHDESQKKLSRIINAAKKLVGENYNFEIIMIGDGPDSNYYKKLVKSNKLERVIKFLGRKENPFPYYLKSSAVILSSLFEGYPVVFNECKVLNIPIITTKVSDYKDIDKKYGIVVEQENIYDGMKYFLNNGFDIIKKFDYEKYNYEIIKKIEKMINS